jgi:hypothetical protein
LLSSGFDAEAVGAAAAGPGTYAVMLANGDPAEAMRVGWVLMWSKRATNRK